MIRNKVLKNSFLILAIGAILMTSCKKDAQKQRVQAPVEVGVTVIGESPESLTQNFVGSIDAASKTAVSFALPGTVMKIHVRDGQQVYSGALLASINDSSFRETHNAALATLRQAEDGYARMKKLHEKGSISEVQWVEMETKLAQAKSSEAVSRKNLENCKLYAPCSGVVSNISVEEGMNVMAGVPILSVLQVDNVQALIPIPETSISSISIGQPVNIKVAALGNQVFQGVVSSKGMVANPLSHSYEVTVPLKNADRALMPGMVCNAWLPSADTTQLIVLPNRVVKISHTGERYVWKVQNRKAVYCPVTTGGLAQRGIIIADGLVLGDTVITNGEQKVSSGSSVIVK